METKRIEATELIRFMEMLHALQGIQRAYHVPGEDRKENDIEHSYLLAMTVWYAIDTFRLSLDKDRAIRYALAHDVPEVHAGDTFVFSTDAEILNGKKDREAEARKRLAKDFPSVPSMHEAMENYEHQTDPEAVFVRALDKIMPLITIYVQDGRSWKLGNVSYSQIADLKRRTTVHCPEVHDIVEQLLAVLDQDRRRFFGENIH
ncbi:HD domain-containing protein [Candidatus Parcubacteria bacterium]|nr:HD domain-containing protein [Candidatus Parcubacteria bacterium]